MAFAKKNPHQLHIMLAFIEITERLHICEKRTERHLHNLFIFNRMI